MAGRTACATNTKTAHQTAKPAAESTPERVGKAPHTTCGDGNQYSFFGNCWLRMRL